jgi:chromosome partitioning protein
MCVSASEFMDAAPSDTLFNLINISDFNSLIAKSHQHSTPVFALTDEQIDQQGEVLATMKTSRDEFRKAFATLAYTVETLTGISKPNRQG